MTPEQVVANLESTQQIVSRSESRIVTQGYDSTWEMVRQNTFVFQDGKLAVHQNIPAGDIAPEKPLKPDATKSWFPGALNLKIIPALPENYIIVSADPSFKGTKEMNILGGVFWTPERTATQIEFGGGRHLNEAKDPLFHVAITPEVRQIAGTDQFTNEKNLKEQADAAGFKKVKIAKTKWGEYPVLSATFENSSDGASIFIAWIGANLPEEWAVQIYYQVPHGEEHPTEEDWKVWEKFISDTKTEK